MTFLFVGVSHTRRKPHRLQLKFLNLFDAGDPRVDFNQGDLVDFSDYLEFLNVFDAGW